MIILLIILGSALYLAPSFVAEYRGIVPYDRRAVYVINILLGWTVFMWFVALIISMRSPKSFIIEGRIWK